MSPSIVLIKVHPDAANQPQKSCFDLNWLKRLPRVQIIYDPCHPVELLRHAKTVYTVTSQLGMEALIWGKHVRCFGMPFYAGWGVTKDEQDSPMRRNSASVEQVIYSALVRYPLYRHPTKAGKSGDIFQILSFLCDVRSSRNF